MRKVGHPDGELRQEPPLPRECLSAGLFVPGVQHRNTERLEVGGITGDDGETVGKRSRGDQRVSFRPWVGHVHARGSSDDVKVDRQDPVVERRQQLLLKPLA